MNLTLQVLPEKHRLYTYAQSQQIYGQTGCIGHLRGDMDSNGTGFFTSWDNHCSNLKTDAFKAEFDTVINMLRFDERYGGVLKNRSSMAGYCYGKPESGFDGNYCREYAFRADTDNYSYLMRLNPNKGDYNFYIYAYQREWLDRHLKNAEKGIRFIKPDYTTLFRIEDFDKVRITFYNGDSVDYTCRYIDEYHVEVGSNLYHICQFAEIMQRNGNKVIPLRASLPETCYSTLANTGEIVIIKRGESGYYPTDIPAKDLTEAKEIVDEMNEKGGVSKAQAEAMKVGSMFGWAAPAADPASYDKNGKLIPPKSTVRGDER